MVIDVAIRKQGSIPATWLRQNWNTKRTISFNTWNSQRLSLHGSSDTTEEQCLHNPLPSLPNLPKRGLYYMGPAQGKVAQHPFYFALIFWCLDLHSLQESQNRVCVHKTEWLVVPYLLLWLAMWLNWRIDVLIKKSVVLSKWFKCIFWYLCW